MNYHENNKSKKERRIEQSLSASKVSRRKLIVSIACWSVFIVAILAGFFFVITRSGTSAQGEYHPSQGQAHIQDGDDHEGYSTNPPTSGDHLAGAADWRSYNDPLSDEQAVHNLEHGGIWISYKNLDDESLKKLKDFANQHSQSVILSPRESNDSTIALAAWERLEKMDVLDMDKVELFYKANKNKSPEPLAGR